MTYKHSNFLGSFQVEYTLMSKITGKKDSAVFGDDSEAVVGVLKIGQMRYCPGYC